MLMNLPTTTSFDSAGLAGLASIAHPLREPGHWRLETHVPQTAASRIVDIVVRDGGKARVAVDLERPRRSDGCCDTREAILAPNGMVNLAGVSACGGGFALLFRGSGSEPAWDSRVLEPGDHFACMPLRPGRYGLTNLLSDARTVLHVSYPDPRRMAQGHRLASSPLQLIVGERITPVVPRIDPGQLLVFAIEAKAHLAVRLEEADDGPPELDEWRVQRSRQVLEAAFAKRGAARANTDD